MRFIIYNKKQEKFYELSDCRFAFQSLCVTRSCRSFWFDLVVFHYYQRDIVLSLEKIRAVKRQNIFFRFDLSWRFGGVFYGRGLFFIFFYKMIKLEEGENLILEGRKHWFIALSNIVGFFLSAIIPVVIFVAAKRWAPTEEIINAGGADLATVVYFLCFIWAFCSWIFLFINLTKYYFDVWYVTNKRLIDIDQKVLFSRDEAVLRLENIQDVATGAKGIIQTLLNFGNIRAQTAGERREFIMRDIANPEKIREVIILEQGKVKDRVVSVKVEEGNL